MIDTDLFKLLAVLLVDFIQRSLSTFKVGHIGK